MKAPACVCDHHFYTVSHEIQLYECEIELLLLCLARLNQIRLLEIENKQRGLAPQISFRA